MVPVGINYCYILNTFKNLVLFQWKNGNWNKDKATLETIVWTKFFNFVYQHFFGDNIFEAILYGKMS